MESIFLAFNLPNSATWFYFSLILTLALFFQFSRVLSVRNLDLLTLYLLTPGFLLLQEAHARMTAAPVGEPGATERARAARELFAAYVWLVAGSAYWFGRAIVDLTLVRRPTLNPNLSPAGLGWLGLALFLCLTAVAVRRGNEPAEQIQIGKRPIPVTQVEAGATAVVQQANTGADGPTSADDIRVWVERSLAMACHAAVVAGLVLIGLRHFGDLTAGMAAATLYLLLPYTAFHIGQFHHVWPTAFLVWAVFCYRRPALSGCLLGVAAGTSFFPLLLLPLWVGFYSRRGSGRFAVWFLAAALLGLGLTALILSWDGRAAASLAAALSLSDWQPWRVPHTESLWTGAHWAYRLPVFVLYIAFVVAITIWPSPKNLSHLIALSAAVLLGVQFWYADRGGVYVLWYLPLLLLMVFRPNLSSHEPPSPAPGGGVIRWAGAAWRWVRPGRQANPPTELAV